MGLFVAIVTILCLTVIYYLVMDFRGIKTSITSQNLTTSADIGIILDNCEYQKKCFKDWIVTSSNGCGRVQECLSWLPRALSIVAWIRNCYYPDDLSYFKR